MRTYRGVNKVCATNASMGATEPADRDLRRMERIRHLISITTKGNKMAILKELTDAVAAAHVALANAQDALSVFSCAPENNVFETIDRATDVLEDRLLGMAGEDCE